MHRDNVKHQLSGVASSHHLASQRTSARVAAADQIEQTLAYSCLAVSASLSRLQQLGIRFLAIHGSRGAHDDEVRSVTREVACGWLQMLLMLLLYHSNTTAVAMLKTSCHRR